jgi:outer membrane receptor protein involved in Fe transport
LGSLEMQIAGRFESYSDFGETTKPKVAAVWRPLPEVLLRASLGESFLAPNLTYLYSSQSVSVTSGSLTDPLRPQDPPTQIRQFGGGNPALQPEETEVTYGGLVLQPFARRKDSLFRELSFGVDYIKFDQTNLLNRIAAQTILGNLTAFGNLVLRNPPAAGQTVGTINGVFTTWQNLSSAQYEAYDFNARWVLPRHNLGQLRVNLSATYAATYEGIGSTGAAFDGDGDYNFPLWRGNATLAWSKGNWASSVYVTYIGEYTTGGSILNGAPDVGEQWLVNPQIAYKGLGHSTLTVGVRNVFDREPPVDPSDSKLVNENVNFVEPMFIYVRWSKDW